MFSCCAEVADENITVVSDGGWNVGNEHEQEGCNDAIADAPSAVSDKAAESAPPGQSDTQNAPSAIAPEERRRSRDKKKLHVRISEAGEDTKKPLGATMPAASSVDQITGMVADGSLVVSASASSSMRQAVTFGASTALRRASRLSTIMHNGAAIFSGSRGSAATYNLSEEVEDIAVFISHNWSVSRSTKFLCLSLYFNFYAAMAIAGVVLVVLVPATFTGMLPTVMTPGGYDRGVCSTVLVAPVFMLALCFGHELRRLPGVRNPWVFLDKTCIHQTDMHVQRQGILKLGAFISCSSQMLVIYSDVYLTKLWTVYEVACFLSLHPPSRIAVVAPSMALFTVGTMTVWYFFKLVAVSTELAEGEVRVETNFSDYLIIPAGLLLLRRMSRMQRAIAERLERFNVEDCTCTSEEDRPLVYNNIAIFMRATGEVGLEATDEEARLAFNRMVPRHLSGRLAAPVRLHYWQCVVIYMFVALPYFLDAWSYPPSTSHYSPLYGLRPATCHTLDHLTWSLGGFPFIVFVIQKQCSCCLDLKGWREWAYLTLVTFSAVMCISILSLCSIMLLSFPCCDQDAVLIAYIPILAGSSLLTGGLFRSLRWKEVERDAAIGADAQANGEPLAEVAAAAAPGARPEVKDDADEELGPLDVQGAIMGAKI